MKHLVLIILTSLYLAACGGSSPPKNNIVYETEWISGEELDTIFKEKVEEKLFMCEIYANVRENKYIFKGSYCPDLEKAEHHHSWWGMSEGRYQALQTKYEKDHYLHFHSVIVDPNGFEVHQATWVQAKKDK